MADAFPLSAQSGRPSAHSAPGLARVALPGDEQALFSCLLALEEDNGMGLTRDDERVWEHIHMACSGQGGIAGVIDGPDGKIVATIGVFMGQSWYSSEWFLKEIWLFVRPEFRKGTGYANELRDFALWHRADMSRRLGQNLSLSTGVNSAKRLAAKARWWRSWGREIGVMFWVDGT